MDATQSYKTLMSNLELLFARARTFDKEGQVQFGEFDDPSKLNALSLGQGGKKGKFDKGSGKGDKGKKGQSFSKGLPGKGPPPYSQSLFQQASSKSFTKGVTKGKFNKGKGKLQWPFRPPFTKGKKGRENPKGGKGQTPCFRCGKLGHRQADCRVVLEVGEPVDFGGNEQQQQQRWSISPVMKQTSQSDFQSFQQAVQQQTHLNHVDCSQNVVLALVDSGAFAHVCPQSFCSHIPLQSNNVPEGEIVTANGKHLNFYGVRRITFRIWEQIPANATFKVCDVHRPILSVSSLSEVGIYAHFCSDVAYLSWKNQRMPLLKINGLYYLPLYVESLPFALESLNGYGSSSTSIRSNVSKLEQQQRCQMLFVEYCCSDQSLLSQEYSQFEDVIRLSLPRFDFSNELIVEAVFSELARIQHIEDRDIFIWISFPYSSLYSKQHERKSSLAQLFQFEAKRRHSCKMIHLLVQGMRKLDPAKTLSAFRWPRMSEGWNLKELKPLIDHFQLVCNFDNCRFDHQTQQPMRKGWTVITNCRASHTSLDGQRCLRTHTHV